MELLQLRYFRVVARLEHMTKAAEELHIAQPSLSKTIRRLEQEVGAPLFDRQGRSIRLNRFGKTFLASVEAAFGALEEGQRKVRDLSGGEGGEVVLAAASLYWLPDLLHRFRERHPSVKFQLSHSPLPLLTQQLEEGACDFCFQSLPLRKAGIHWQTLLREDVLLVVSPTHHWAERESVTFREVAGESVVIEPVGSGLRDLVDHFCEQAGFALRPAYEIDEPAALMEFVKAELGVGFVPSQMKPQIAEHGLLPLRVTDPDCQRTFGMAWHEGRYLSQAARTFQKFATAYFAEKERVVKREDASS